MADRANEGMLAAYGIDGCGCAECVGKVVSARPFPDNLMYPFIVCETCGNKRCPRAAHHDNECTGSNEPGQPGSNYPAFDPSKSPRTIGELREALDNLTAPGPVPESTHPKGTQQ